MFVLEHNHIQYMVSTRKKFNLMAQLYRDDPIGNLDQIYILADLVYNPTIQQVFKSKYDMYDMFRCMTENILTKKEINAL